MAVLRTPIPIPQFPAGTPVGTDLYVGVDTTDTSESTLGTTKKYELQDLANFVLIQDSNRESCVVGTTTNLDATYYVGTADPTHPGVGATLVNAGALSALSIDGVALAMGDRVLVKDQTNTAHNGIYDVSVVGDASTAWVLTRSEDYDAAIDYEITLGSFTIVSRGTSQALSLWVMISDTPAVGNIGTSPITFEALDINLFSSILSLGKGGTNASLTADNGAIVYSTASALALLASTATANQIVLSGSSSAPSWSTATYPATTVVNQILFSSATNTISGITAANSSVLVSNGSGVPSWATTLPALSGPLDIDNLRLQTNTLSSTNTNGNVNIAPHGSGQAVFTRNSTATTEQVVINQSGSGDNMLSWDLNGTQTYSAGIDNSDNDFWKFVTGTDLSTNQAITVTTDSTVCTGDPGTEADGINIGGVTYNAVLKASDIGGSAPAQFVIHRHSTTLQAVSVGSRSNSDTNSHADVTNSQNLWTLYGAGWAGSNYKLFGGITFGVDSSGTVSNTSAPGRMIFSITPDASVVPATWLTVTNDKTAAFAGSITLGTPLALDQGGTAKALTADNGAIVYSDADSFELLASTATANQVLLSGSSAAPSWSTATYPGTTTINQLLYSSATNTVAGLATANSALLLTDNSGVPAFSSSLTDGQLVIGNSGATPSIAQLTPGTGISIANGSGTITISASGGGVGWVEENDATANLSANEAVIGNRGTAQTFTLPSSAAQGDYIRIVQIGAGAITIAQNAGQTIHFGTTDSTTGAGGTVTFDDQYNAIELICTTTDTDFTVLSSIGNFTVV